ncbi:MAG: gliding motility-associated C-terminal domain-containing protein, partial [Parafilimonas sp.]|nr:gliding motility-associated C-terminal domain-containing protein [Parafilimonas sp.]
DSNVIIESGSGYQTVTQGSEDIISWQWSPPSGISCLNCPAPVLQPVSNQTYTVLVKNIAGCSVEKHITITVLCKGQNLFIPNTFSPNGDGMNDYFYPRGKGFSVKSLRIFSRWGTIVYERTNFPPNQQAYGWDGTYNGKAATPDVYVFIAEILCDNGGIITTKGNITLLR